MSDNNIEREHKQFELYKGKINNLTDIICQSVECNENEIEISRNLNVFYALTFLKQYQKLVNGSGLSLYLIHFVNNTIDLRDIIKFYQEKEEYVKNEFKKHFHFNDENFQCMIK
eukprot:349361_1